MSDARAILILCPAVEETLVSARLLADALSDLGATAVVYDMTTSYDDVLDEVVRADSIVVWR